MSPAVACMLLLGSPHYGFNAFEFNVSMSAARFAFDTVDTALEKDWLISGLSSSASKCCSAIVT
jgi:hypothetical protein